VRGFIAVTDPGWYQRLHALGSTLGPMDANFWRPSPRRVGLATGTPFLFKLRAPSNAIAGFGYFASFSVLPDWLAWDTFGEANGVASLEELRSRLLRIREGASIEADPQGRIGCSLIAEAVFFPRDQWVTCPSDWKPRTQTGSTYDLSSGEGLRVWNECRARLSMGIPGAAPSSIQPFRAAEARARYAAPAQDGVAEPRARYGAAVTYFPRLGQGIFRVQVLDAYDRACAVTQEHSLVVLEAAHLKPYAAGGEHDVRNGLALRTDLHKLFDRGYVTVDEDHRFVVGGRLKADFDNGKSYYELHGRSIVAPKQSKLRPSRDALGWHRERVFLG
jgi:putative restriction endonuclease